MQFGSASGDILKRREGTGPLTKSRDPPDDDAIGENVEVIIVPLAGRARGRYALGGNPRAHT
jgi:hypothetical protein